MDLEGGERMRLAFLRLEPHELALLRDLRPLLEERVDGFVSAFYRHLLSFGPTRDHLRDPSVQQRLLAKQRDYLLSLAEPTCDDAFYRNRREIGAAHERVGLEPRWFLGAYATYHALLTPAIMEFYSHDPGRGVDSLVALQKLLNYDCQVVMESYIERQQRDLEALTEELAKASRQLSRDFEDQGRELRETRQWARAAAERVEVATLVAGLAHEIGTPMGVIQGHAKLLESAVSGDDAVWRLRTIQEQIGRISKIIRALLKMSRPETRPRYAPLKLDSALDTTLSFVSEKLARRAINVVRRFEPVETMLGDAERLQQIFLNLFLNAADAMPDGGELAITLGMDADGMIEVLVADTGVGIAEDDLPRVFEPFFTTKPAGQGTGLGLMVVRTIVSEHGGDVEVESQLGAGTAFTIRFPTT